MIRSLIVTGLISAAGVFFARAANPPAATGLVIETSSDVSANELARILDISVWKCSFTIPADMKDAEISCEMIPKGGKPQPLSGGSGLINSAGGKFDFLLSIQPLDGLLFEAEKVRVKTFVGGGSSTHDKDNPLKGLTGSTKPKNPTLNTFGSDTFVSYYKGPTISSDEEADVAFAIRITPLKRGKPL